MIAKLQMSLNGNFTASAAFSRKDGKLEGGIAFYINGDTSSRFGACVRWMSDKRVDAYLTKIVNDRWKGYLIGEGYETANNGGPKDCFVSVDAGWDASADTEILLTLMVAGSKARLSIFGNNTKQYGEVLYDLTSSAYLYIYTEPTVSTWSSGELAVYFEDAGGNVRDFVCNVTPVISTSCELQKPSAQKPYLRQVVMQQAPANRSFTDDPDMDRNTQDVASFIESVMTLDSGDEIVNRIFSSFGRGCYYLSDEQTEIMNHLIAELLQNAYYASDLDKRLEISRIIDLLREEDTAGSTTDSLIEQTCDYIAEHQSEQITVEAIAKAIHVSHYYLCHVFKAKTGITLVQYLQNRRLSFAKKLLRTTKRSVLDIALTCGFSDASYFSMLFRRTYNMTPREYRSRR